MNEKNFEKVLEENGSFVWKSVGVSMRPLIREGKDLIVIKRRPPQRLKRYDVVLFKRPGVTGRGAYVLHRILKVNDNGTYWIVGDNCIDGETVKEENIIGILSAVIRNRKKIDGENFFYKCYVRLWCAPYPFRFFVLKYKSYPRRVVRKLLRIMERIFVKD